jgi:cytidylate kinase
LRDGAGVLPVTPFVVTIDGPAAAGKSTTARALARRLGCLYLDSGALYRALAVKVLERGVAPGDAGAVAELVRGTELDLVPAPDGARVLVDGRDVTGAIRTLSVAEVASTLAPQAAVRERMGEVQRRVAERRSVVAEGRDTGTVVFPDADVKIYLDASLDERAARRARELAAGGADAERVRAELERRDRRDRERELAPLAAAPDSVVVDTTGLSVDEQVEKVLGVIRSRRPEIAATDSS